ncbi:MFS transporter [Klebsiella pneumoniae]
MLPIVLIYFFTSNFPQENKYVNVLELQEINKSTTEEVLHKNSSEKISVVERAKVYLCNSNFWILLAVFSSNSMLSWGVVTWLPTYLNTERGFSWANVGWMSALPFIFGLLFKVLAGFIVDKTDRKGMVMFVSAMLCAASILTGVNISNNFSLQSLSPSVSAPPQCNYPVCLPSCNQWFLQKRCRLQRGL